APSPCEALEAPSRRFAGTEPHDNGPPARSAVTRILFAAGIGRAAVTAVEDIGVEHAVPHRILLVGDLAARGLRVIDDRERAVFEVDRLGRCRVAVRPLDILDHYQLEVKLEEHNAALVGARAAGAAKPKNELLVVPAGAARVEEVRRGRIDLLRDGEGVEIDLARAGTARGAAHAQRVVNA